MLEAGWPSGWRDYDMADAELLKGSMESVGVPVDGFDEYIGKGGAGEDDLNAAMDSAMDTGCVGVPHLVFPLAESALSKRDDGRVGWFGREHLPFVRHQMHQLGLARHADVQPDFPYYYVTNVTA